MVSICYNDDYDVLERWLYTPMISRRYKMANEFTTRIAPKIIRAETITQCFKKAVELDIQSKKQNGTPIPGYDKASKKAYLEYADGRREYYG